MVKKLIQGVGVTAACLQLALLPAKAADPAVSLTKDGNNIRADLELTESTQNSDVVSLKLSFEVDKKPSENDIHFEFDDGIKSQVTEYRYHQESGRLNIYISGNQKLFEGEKLTLGTVVFSNNVKNAKISVVTDSLVTVNDAFYMEEIRLPDSSANQGSSGDSSGSGSGSGGSGDSSGSGSGSSGGSGGSGGSGSGGSSSGSSGSPNQYTSSSSSYENRNLLSSTEAESVSAAASQIFGGVSQVRRVEKTSGGICIISKENDVIFLKNNGELAKNEWQLCGADWYYLDADKRAAKGWKVVGGKWYYLNKSSKKMEKGWLKSPESGKWYYLDAVNGDMKTGWQKINQKWYYLDAGNGDMKTGWQQINQKWYYLDAGNGDMKTGWQQINQKWYYLDAVNGDMKIGWQQVNQKWYYLDTVNGNCWINTITPDGYKVNESGEWILQ